MARGRGRGSRGCLGKSSFRGDSAIRATMPSIPISTTISPQQDMGCKSSTKLITLQWNKVQMIVYSVSTYQVLLVMVQLWRLLTEEYLCFREVIKLENSLDILFFLGGHLEAVEKGRDPIPSKVHLHAHTHDHDGESFVDERARAVHERYEEILREKSQSQFNIDQSEAYYEAAGGAKKR